MNSACAEPGGACRRAAAAVGVAMQRCCLAAIRGYRYLISPLFPPCCRFVPTCSQYAMEAITLHGFCRGGLMALKRILRCHPFSRGGFDPVK